MTPLRPLLLDLRQYPICERPLQAFLSLEEMGVGDTLLVMNDRSLDPFLQQLRLVLEKGFTCWVTEDGPEVWRMLISRGE
ncbi:MAG: DUF2249 domain-containing protein [Deltaproteobacteria bacterium]|nr:DUF2249 domain-containing protein [Deltaproteobacteria bacterium]